MSSPDGSTVSFRRTPPDFGRRTVERFARRLQKEVAKGQAFDCLITGDADLRRLNQQFRGKDYPTDVLSFPSTWPSESLGDLAISLGRARAQARHFGHAIEEEVQVLMLHGVLHLLGLDHETDEGQMARAEKRWRVKLGLPDGLIARNEEASRRVSTRHAGVRAPRGRA
jgi:probable rRNA maturation factor